MLLLLLLAALAACASGAPLAGSQVRSVMISSELRYLAASGVELEGTVYASVQTATAEVCAQKCADAGPTCSWFTASCDSTQTCLCELFTSTCTLAPSVSTETPASGVAVTSGVPLRYELPDLDVFAAEDGLAVLDANLPECPGSELAGLCGFKSLMDAGRTCTQFSACKGVNVFWNGTDGCGSAAFVLVSEQPAGNNTFVSPLVSSFTKRGSPQDVVLRATEGTVYPPTAAELDAAAASADPDSAWLGCIIAPRSILAGTLVQVLENVPSPQACCRACRSKGVATANVWNYCAEPGGCIYTLPNGKAMSMQAGQCELRYNVAANLAMGGFPPSVVAKGPQVPFIGGSPIAVVAAPLQGYEALLGAFMYSDIGSFNCSESIRPTLNECWVDGDTQQLGETCDVVEECVALVVKPGWLGLPEPQTIGILKNFTSVEDQYLSPTSILYVNNTRLQLLGGAATNSSGGSTGGGTGGSTGGGSSGGSSSSLSSGAIAGIAVGATAVGLVAAAGGWALLRRRRQRQRTASGAGVSEEGSKVATNGTANRGSFPEAFSWGSQQPPLQPGPSTGQLGQAPLATVGSTAGSPFQVERGFTLRAATAVSPFATMASRGGSNALAINTYARPAASPFAAAAQARATAAQQPTSPMQPGSPPVIVGTASGQSGALGQYVQNPAASGGLATLAGISTMASGAPTLGNAGSSSGTAASLSAGSSARILPELQAHIAAMDAGMSVGCVLAGHEGVESGGDLLSELSLLAPGSLPEALRDVLVDITELQPLRWPNGALQELGSGGSATVYKVLFRGEAVAAKEMEVGRDLACQRAFIAEAERLHALRHAHLVPLYGVCLSGSKGILLLEFCAGRDLHSALGVQKQGGRGERLFGWYSRGRQVALDVAKALNYLHSRSIVHLDIKSSNVLLTATGTAKLADVGLARAQRGTALSCAPKAVGTFDYMAPEMITNSRCTLAVDMFSMGILLWEICTGERPRRGDMRLPRVPEECPQEVADLISQCMALEPSERPTAQQLMQRLQEVPKRGTAVQQPPSPRARDVPSLRQSTSPAVTGEGLSSL